MRIFLAMRIDAYVGYIRHMSDIARYCRIMRVPASAWPSLMYIRPYVVKNVTSIEGEEKDRTEKDGIMQPILV